MAPSIYLAYQMVEENLRDMQVKSFISEDMVFQTTSVVSYTVKDHVHTVDLVGTLLTEKEIAALQDELHARNRLQDLELVVIQGQRELDREQVQNLINARLEKQSTSERKSLQEHSRAVLPSPTSARAQTSRPSRSSHNRALFSSRFSPSGAAH